MPPRDPCEDHALNYGWALYVVSRRVGHAPSLVTRENATTPAEALEQYANAGNVGEHELLGDPACTTYAVIKVLRKTFSPVNGFDCIALFNLEPIPAPYNGKPTVKAHLCSSDPGGIKAEALYRRDLVLDEHQINENISRLQAARERLRCHTPPNPQYRAVPV